MERTKLIQARYDKGWSQEQAAEAIGVSRVTLSQWENGLKHPYPANVHQCCKVYEKDAAALDLGREQMVTRHDLEMIGPDPLEALLQGDLLHHLMRLIHTWPQRDTRYHELQAQVMQRTEDHMKFESDSPMSRRDAMRRLALFPIEMYGLTSLTPVVIHPVEDVLTQCAAGITACWYIVRGQNAYTDFVLRNKEILFASHVISSYIPTLQALVASSSALQRKAAADLLVQCFLLKAKLARDIKGSNDGIAYTQHAVLYSKMAENPLLEILALRTLASIQAYTQKQWALALRTAEQAQHILEHTSKQAIPLHVHSYIYSGLATYQAYHGHIQQALTSLGKSHATFEQSINEAIPIWIDHSQVNVHLNDGVTHIHLGLSKEALDAFARTDHVAGGEISTIEICIHEVMAEVQRDDKPRNMEWCIDRWSQGVQGARKLESDQWFNEARSAYASMRVAWPGESRVKELRDLLVHW